MGGSKLSDNACNAPGQRRETKTIEKPEPVQDDALPKPDKGAHQQEEMEEESHQGQTLPSTNFNPLPIHSLAFWRSQRSQTVKEHLKSYKLSDEGSHDEQALTLATFCAAKLQVEPDTDAKTWKLRTEDETQDGGRPSRSKKGGRASR